MIFGLRFFQVVMRDGHDDGIECFTKTIGSDLDIKPKLDFFIGDMNATKYEQ